MLDENYEYSGQMSVIVKTQGQLLKIRLSEWGIMPDNEIIVSSNEGIGISFPTSNCVWWSAIFDNWNLDYFVVPSLTMKPVAFEKLMNKYTEKYYYGIC